MLSFSSITIIDDYELRARDMMMVVHGHDMKNAHGMDDDYVCINANDELAWIYFSSYPGLTPPMPLFALLFLSSCHGSCYC